MVIMNLPHSIPRHKLSLKAYQQMARAGVFEEDSRIELIYGELIDAALVGPYTRLFGKPL